MRNLTTPHRGLCPSNIMTYNVPLFTSGTDSGISQFSVIHQSCVISGLIMPWVRHKRLRPWAIQRTRTCHKSAALASASPHRVLVFGRALKGSFAWGGRGSCFHHDLLIASPLWEVRITFNNQLWHCSRKSRTRLESTFSSCDKARSYSWWDQTDAHARPCP